MSSSAINVEQVSKSFDKSRVLNELDITVPSRSVYAFLGNNGEGKSTTIRMLLGLLKPDSGHIHVLGTPVSKLNKHQVGAIIDAPVLYSHLTAVEFLSITRAIKNLPKTEIGRVLELVGLRASGMRKISAFSLGMKQRLALAQALMGNPRLLILDEPTNGLDPQGMLEIRNLIMQLPKNADTTVFVSSHLLDEVEKMASHVGILQHGKLILESSLRDAYTLMTSTLKLEVCCSKKAVIALQYAGYQASPQSATSLTLANPSFDEIPDITHCLVSNGLRLFQSIYHKPTLEQWFLRANQKGG